VKGLSGFEVDVTVKGLSAREWLAKQFKGSQLLLLMLKDEKMPDICKTSYGGCLMAVDPKTYGFGIKLEARA
jgi:hypothetical protein